MPPRIALATCATLPDLDPDDRLLLEALDAFGVAAMATVWDDPRVDWAGFDLVVVRNTWDYPTKHDEFLEWTRRVPRLMNPADVITWNTDKRYLADLARAGVPIVPSTWLTPDDAVVLPAHGRHVLKPAVGAGSLGAAAFSMHEEHEAKLARDHALRLLSAGRTVMVQPYIDGIEQHGESALIYLGGEFSHAITKGAMLTAERGLVGGLFFQETITRREPSAAELAVAQRTLAAVPGGSDRLAYARVDLVPDRHGRPLLMELELTEPSLYLGFERGAAERFANVLNKRATRKN